MRGIHKRAATKPHSNLRIGMLTLAGVGLIASACGSSSTTSATATTSGSSGSGTTQAASSSGSGGGYFKGKTITIIAPDNAGGGFDKYARLIAPGLGKALGATVNVENIPGGGTITGTDKMVASKPDGLTLGMVNIPGDIGDKLQHNTALKVDLNKLSWIGLAAPATTVMISSPNSPYTSFAQLKAAKKQVLYGGSKSGITWVGGATLMRAFKINTKFLTGYGSEVKTAQGLVANEFDVTYGDIAGPYYSDLVGHRAHLLLASGPSSVPSVEQVIKGAPEAPQIEAQLSGKAKAAVTEAFNLGNLEFAFAGPPGLSSSKLSALRKAFMTVMTSSATKAQANKEKLELAPIDGSTLAKKVTTAETQASAVSPYIQ